MINMSKRDLWHYVNKKIKRVIHHYHVFAIISLLFEEMILDLKNGKEIKVANFGTLMLKKMPPRKYYDVRFQKMMESQGHHILRLFLSKTIKKKLSQFLELDTQKKEIK